MRRVLMVSLYRTLYTVSYNKGALIMFGIATLEIPRSGVIGPSCYPGLSDHYALVLGRFAARTLSDEDVYYAI